MPSCQVLGHWLQLRLFGVFWLYVLILLLILETQSFWLSIPLSVIMITKFWVTKEFLLEVRLIETLGVFGMVLFLLSSEHRLTNDFPVVAVGFANALVFYL